MSDIYWSLLFGRLVSAEGINKNLILHSEIAIAALR